MSDPFLDYEASRENSEPVELYAITVSTGQAYYLTSGVRDVTYDGRVYKATAIDRGEVGVDSGSEAREMEMRIAIDHPLVKRWTAYGIPPKRTTVVCYRLQHELAELLWTGDATSLAWDGAIAKLRIPARMNDALQRKVPNVSCSTTCTHILYDRNCGISKTGATPGGLSHQVTTTAIHVSGRDVRVDLGTTDRNGSWAERGTLTHQATGEAMTIREQADMSPGTNGLAVLSLQARLIELKVGDTVVIQRGCRNTIEDCAESFNNVGKFSGYPQLPTTNPYKIGKLI